eukprot:31385-Pelagococcus_subviridis.AAC.15
MLRVEIPLRSAPFVLQRARVVQNLVAVPGQAHPQPDVQVLPERAHQVPVLDPLVPPEPPRKQPRVRAQLRRGLVDQVVQRP